MPVPAVLYAAKSTIDKHLSIPTQLENGREMAGEEDWEVVGEFHDENFSAYSGNRGPDLRRAEAAAEQATAKFGTVAMLVVQHSDRLARGAGDRPGASDSLVEVWTRLRRKNVHVRSFQNDSMMGDVVLVAVASKQAFEESERKSKAVKDGMKRRAKERGLSSGRAPIGYKHVKDTGLVEDVAWAPVVRRIFEEWVAGKPQIQIARDLNRDGIRTPRGKPWRQTAVRLILRNCVYAGLVSYATEEVYEGRHEAIVDKGTWEKAQAMRTSKAKTTGPGRPTSGSHLFSHSLLFCECGWAMRPRTFRNKDGSTREVYICEGRTIDIDNCSTSIQSRAPIDTSVFHYFAAVGLDLEATREQLAEAQAHKLSEAKALLDQADSQAQRAEAKLTRIRGDYAEGKIEAEDWASFRDELTTDLAGARAEAKHLIQRVEDIENSAALRDLERDNLTKLSDLRGAIAGEIQSAEGIEAVRAALARIFDRFVVKRIQPGVRVHADLAWQGEFYLEPVPREQAVEGYTSLRPVFRREPVYDAGTNIAKATLSTRSPPSTPRPT